MPKTYPNKKNQSYFLDVSEYIITEAHQTYSSPKINMPQNELNEVSNSK
jgi:hypothetical protein